MKNKMYSFFKKTVISVTLGIVFVFSCVNVKADEENIYYLGEVINAGKDTGFSEKNKIEKKDPHYNWELGSFYVDGFTRVIVENKNPVFLKTIGDTITLNFKLQQDINALNNDSSLEIANDEKGYDYLLQKDETAFGKGALIIRKTDAYQNKKADAELYTNYLSGVKVGANTEVKLCEEGDYEVALDYSIRDKKITLPFIDKTIRSKYYDYRIFFKFSVRNGNCMVFPFDTITGEELTNKSITENGFYLDLAKSRYLDINIKKEVLREGANGLTEDVRFNKPASDGDKYTEEGIYTITVSNPYTSEQTVKKIYVGNDDILKAYMVTGYSISDIQSLVKDGATIEENGQIKISEEILKPNVIESITESANIINQPNTSDVQNSVENPDVINESKTYDKFMIRKIGLLSAVIALTILIVSVVIKKKKNKMFSHESGENDVEGDDRN